MRQRTAALCNATIEVRLTLRGSKGALNPALMIALPVRQGNSAIVVSPNFFLAIAAIEKRMLEVKVRG